MAVVPQGGLTVADDGRSASLALTSVPVIDQPEWPKHDAAVTAATMTFRVTWRARSEPVQIDDAAHHFRFRGWKAETRLEAEVSVPSAGFTWKSDPIETSGAQFGIIGEESNGRYFDGTGQS